MPADVHPAAALKGITHLERHVPDGAGAVELEVDIEIRPRVWARSWRTRRALMAVGLAVYIVVWVKLHPDVAVDKAFTLADAAISPRRVERAVLI